MISTPSSPLASLTAHLHIEDLALAASAEKHSQGLAVQQHEVLVDERGRFSFDLHFYQRATGELRIERDGERIATVEALEILPGATTSVQVSVPGFQERWLRCVMGDLQLAHVGIAIGPRAQRAEGAKLPADEPSGDLFWSRHHRLDATGFTRATLFTDGRSRYCHIDPSSFSWPTMGFPQAGDSPALRKRRIAATSLFALARDMPATQLQPSVGLRLEVDLGEAVRAIPQDALRSVASELAIFLERERERERDDELSQFAEAAISLAGRGDRAGLFALLLQVHIAAHEKRGAGSK